MRSELYFRPTLSEAATITGGVAIGDSSTRLPALLTTHSEEVCPGDLFCALPGQKQDGNHFLPRALLRGAGMLLCSTPPAIRTVPVLLAEDAVAAATIIPAREIGCADTVGSIEPGKLADFVVCAPDLTPKAVYLGGKIVE